MDIDDNPLGLMPMMLVFLISLVVIMLIFPASPHKQCVVMWDRYNSTDIPEGVSCSYGWPEGCGVFGGCSGKYVLIGCSDGNNYHGVNSMIAYKIPNPNNLTYDC